MTLQTVPAPATAGRPDLTREAVAIADRFVDEAIWHGDRCTWIHRNLQEPPDPLGRGPLAETLGADIYGGVSGVAWFLAKTFEASQEPRHARTARGAILQALHLVRRELPDADVQEGAVWVGPAAPSFYSGGLGVAWLGIRIAGQMQDTALAVEARGLLRTYCEKRPMALNNDLLGGAAGAILALLDLHAHGERGTLDYAVRLGEHLLETRVETEHGAAWPWVSRGRLGTPLTGYSHGTSGYAQALLSLGAVTGDDRYGAAGRDALAYERGLYDPQAGNWPDLRELEGRSKDHPSFMTAWCHGAPGIGLARTWMARHFHDDEMDQEVRDALETTLRQVEQSGAVPDWSFTGCHGLAGNIECALAMAEHVGDDDATAHLLALADARVRMYGTGAAAYAVPGLTDWPTGRPGYTDLGLLKGLAGAGFFLLRLGSGGTVPTHLMPGRFDAEDDLGLSPSTQENTE